MCLGLAKKPRSRALGFGSACSCVSLGLSLNFSGLQCPLSGTGVGMRVFIPPSLPHEAAGKLWGARDLEDF